MRRAINTVGATRNIGRSTVARGIISAPKMDSRVVQKVPTKIAPKVATPSRQGARPINNTIAPVVKNTPTPKPSFVSATPPTQPKPSNDFTFGGNYEDASKDDYTVDNKPIINKPSVDKTESNAKLINQLKKVAIVTVAGGLLSFGLKKILSYA